MSAEHQPHDRKASEQAIRTSSSRGEKLFDWLTYGGVAGVGTFLLTIPVAYWAKYGSGAKMFEKASGYLVKQGLSPRISEEMVMTTALMQGGNLTIIPVKMLENRKPQIVDYFNDRLGDSSGKASVEEDPKQTWSSLIKSRIVAWLSVFTGFRVAGSIFGADKFAAFEESFAKNVVCKPLGKPTHIRGVETPHFRYGKIAALDVFATAAATAILYTGSRFFAKRNEHWHAENTNTTAASVPTAAASQAPAVQPSTAESERGISFTERLPAPSSKPAIKPRDTDYRDTIGAEKQAGSGKSLSVTP